MKIFENQNRKLNQKHNNQHQKNQHNTPKDGIIQFFLCYNCGKPDHMTRKCWNMSNLAPRTNLTEEALVAMLTEINLVGESEGWWIDTGAYHHICYEREIFKTYNAANDMKVMLGDSHATVVVGNETVELKFTFESNLLLKDVMHTPEMKKNLISGFLLNNAGFT